MAYVSMAYSCMLHDLEDAEHADVGAAELTDGAEQPALDARIADEAEHVQTAASENKGKVQMFQVSIQLRDDWLHRGDAPQDMDL